MAGRVHKEVINGRMCVVRPRRSSVDVLVFAGPEELNDSAAIADWELPLQLRYDLHGAAVLAEAQTDRTEVSE